MYVSLVYPFIKRSASDVYKSCSKSQSKSKNTDLRQVLNRFNSIVFCCTSLIPLYFAVSSMLAQLEMDREKVTDKDLTRSQVSLEVNKISQMFTWMTAHPDTHDAP